MTTHAGCRVYLPTECNFGILQPIYLPPHSVSIPRTEVPIEAIIGVQVKSKTTLVRDYSCRKYIPRISHILFPIHSINKANILMSRSICCWNGANCRVVGSSPPEWMPAQFTLYIAIYRYSPIPQKVALDVVLCAHIPIRIKNKTTPMISQSHIAPAHPAHSDHGRQLLLTPSIPIL